MKKKKNEGPPLEQVPPGVQIHVSKLPNGKIRIALLDFKHRCMLDNDDIIPPLSFLTRTATAKYVGGRINAFRQSLAEAGVF